MKLLRHAVLALTCTTMATIGEAQMYTPSGVVSSTTGGSNVGVGEAAPSARLEVFSGSVTGTALLRANSRILPGEGGLYTTDYLLRGTYQADPTSGILGYENPKTVFNIDHLGKTQIGDFPIVPGDDYLAVRYSAGVYNSTTEYFRLRFANNNHELFWVSNNNRNFRFRNSNTGAIPLTLSPAGKVGVNTSNFVGTHSLYIEGTTIAEEIFVKLSMNWPDYVFTPAHKRMPLQELDRYISIHKRLPGMPAAEKVAADGIEMGETVRLLTEKVEEITLYLIDLKKENDTLKAEIESLKGGKKRKRL